MGLMDVVKLLVEKFQASTEIKDENNSKPLHRVILNGRVDIAIFMNKGPLQSLDFVGFCFSG
jgi:ankyrin repeat protein